MKVETTRVYTHSNGYSSEKFELEARTRDKKIIDFKIKINNDIASTDLMQLISKDLLNFSILIEESEKGKNATIKL